MYARNGLNALNNKYLSAALKNKLDIKNDQQFDLISESFTEFIHDILADEKAALNKYFTPKSIDFIEKIHPQTLNSVMKIIKKAL